MFYQKESLAGRRLKMFHQEAKTKVEAVPSVDLRCKICEAGITNHKVGCSSRYLFEPGDEKRDKEYLWFVSYFRKYGEGSVWGEWIQDSLDMKIVYSDTKSSGKETMWVSGT